MDHVTNRATAIKGREAASNTKEMRNICRRASKRGNRSTRVGQPFMAQKTRATPLNIARPPRSLILFFLFLFFRP